MMGEVNSLFVQLNTPNLMGLFSIVDDCICLTLRVKIQRGNQVSYFQRQNCHEWTFSKAEPGFCKQVIKGIRGSAS